MLLFMAAVMPLEPWVCSLFFFVFFFFTLFSLELSRIVSPFLSVRLSPKILGSCNSMFDRLT